MADEVETKEVKDPKKGKNLLVILAVIILIVSGIYFVSSKNVQKNGPTSSVSNSPTQALQSSSTELTSKKWTWLSTKMSDGSVSVPSKDGAFTATFQPDDRLVATTDCNNGNGSYELGENNSLTIGPMASTMMFCEGSSEGAYLQQLQNVGSYKIENGQLWLMLKLDSGTMTFE